MSCLWCGNPEGQSFHESVLFDSKKSGYNASEKCGQIVSVDEVFAVIEEDRAFYESSGGGVTLGGGEPLAQPDFSLALLKKCKSEGINTALETSAYTAWRVLDELLHFVDYLFVDLKVMDNATHKAVTGKGNVKILRNIAALFEKKSVHFTIRIPFVSGTNDDRDNLHKSAEFLASCGAACSRHFQGVELLPYHRLGEGKYEKLGLTIPLQVPKVDLRKPIQLAEDIFRGYNIKVFCEGVPHDGKESTKNR